MLCMTMAGAKDLSTVIREVTPSGNYLPWPHEDTLDGMKMQSYIELPDAMAGVNLELPPQIVRTTLVNHDECLFFSSFGLEVDTPNEAVCPVSLAHATSPYE